MAGQRGGRVLLDPRAPSLPKEVFAYWREPIEMYWGEQPFTVTPEYVARLIELRYSPTGPSANAFRHMATPPTYTIMSRIDIGVMSLIAELRATNQWATIAAEYFEGADPATAMGKADRAYREELARRRAAMPDWTAWPFPTEDPYPAYHAARAQAPVQWNEPLGAHLVLSHEHAASRSAQPRVELRPAQQPADCSPPSAAQEPARSCGASRC